MLSLSQSGGCACQHQLNVRSILSAERDLPQTSPVREFVHPFHECTIPFSVFALAPVQAQWLRAECRSAVLRDQHRSCVRPTSRREEPHVVLFDSSPYLSGSHGLADQSYRSGCRHVYGSPHQLRTGSQRFRRRRLGGTGGRRFGMHGPDGGWLVARGLLWYAVTDATQQ